MLLLNPKLSDFIVAIIDHNNHIAGGNKSRPYLVGETPFVVAGFIPANNGQKVTKITQIG